MKTTMTRRGFLGVLGVAAVSAVAASRPESIPMAFASPRHGENGEAARDDIVNANDSAASRSTTTAKDVVDVSTFGDELCAFQVITDIHVGQTANDITGAEVLDNALGDIRENASDTDAIVSVGDLADTGSQNEYDDAKDLFDEHGFGESTLFAAIGNHEAHDAATYEEDWARFQENFGLNANYHDRIINDCAHLIALGSDRAPLNEDRASLSEDELEWLDDLLTADEAAGRMSFVFIHQPVANTIANTYSGEWGYKAGIENSDEVRAVLDAHSNVVIMSGHTHWDLNHAYTPESTVYQRSNDEPLYVHAGGGISLLHYDGEGEYRGSAGWFITVYESAVVLIARDFEHHGWLYAVTLQR